MLRSYIGKIVAQLAYVAYMKIYGIHDKPFESIRIYLSDEDNQWNTIALSASTRADNMCSITICSNENVRLSDENNSWNKLAIAQKGLCMRLAANVAVPNKPHTL